MSGRVVCAAFIIDGYLFWHIFSALYFCVDIWFGCNNGGLLSLLIQQTLCASTVFLITRFTLETLILIPTARKKNV